MQPFNKFELLSGNYRLKFYSISKKKSHLLIQERLHLSHKWMKSQFWKWNQIWWTTKIKFSKLIDHNENNPLSNCFHFQNYFFMSYIYWRVTLVTGRNESKWKISSFFLKPSKWTISDSKNKNKNKNNHNLSKKKKVLLNLN